MKKIYRLFVVGICLSSTASYASGDEKRGEQLYSSLCIACHSVDANLAGPAHRGVFGRKAGSANGFDYSPALENSKVIWNERTLDRWLMNPEKLIPGQQMAISVSSAKDRKDLIAFLKIQTLR